MLGKLHTRNSAACFCFRSIAILSVLASIFLFSLFRQSALPVSQAQGLVGTSSASQSPSWIELAPTGTPPNPIYGPKPVHYDAINNRLIVFFPGNPPHNGNPPGNGNEVWILTNANGLGGQPQWIKLQPTGAAPASNLFESVVYDAATNRLIVYGGCFASCAPSLSGVFVLTNANGLGGTPVWTQSTVTNPQTRTSHSSVYDAVNNLMISFGGQQGFFGTDQNDTRLLSNANGTISPSTWATLSTVGSAPPIRDEHTAIYDQASNRMTIFAGHNLIRTCCPYVISDYNDLWTLSNANGQGGTPTWTQLSPVGSLPPVRTGHSAVYDPVNNRMLVFGGGQWSQTAQTTTPIGDLWQLSNANGLGGVPVWTQIAQNCVTPGPRFYHTAVFDAANQRMIILGGRDSNDQPSNRVWVLAPNCPAISISPTTLAQGITGTPYSQSFLASGGSGPYTFKLTGSLPNGVTFANGALSGTPTQSGSFSFSLTATDQNGCSGCQSYTLVVNCPEISLSPASLSTGVTGSVYPPTTFSAPGGSGAISFALSGALPNGMSFANGTLSGTPTQTGNFNFNVRATDSKSCFGERQYTLTVNCPAIIINPATLAGGAVGAVYPLVTFTANGGSSPYSFSFSGSVPAGMSFANGMLSGTPTVGGTFSFTVTAMDQFGCTGSRNYSLFINRPPVIAPATGLMAFVNKPFSFTPSASDPDVPPQVLSFSMTGAPAGASISPTTGAVTWTPTAQQIGVHTFTITVRDNGSPSLSASQVYSVEVRRQTVTLTIRFQFVPTEFGSILTAIAQLKDALTNTPLAGRTLTLTQGIYSITQPTNANGEVLLGIRRNGGSYTATANFAGDAVYESKTVSAVYNDN